MIKSKKKSYNYRLFIVFLPLFIIGILMLLSYDKFLGGILSVAALVGMAKDLTHIAAIIMEKDSQKQEGQKQESHVSQTKTVQRAGRDIINVESPVGTQNSNTDKKRR